MNVANRWTGGGEAGVHFYCPGCKSVHGVRTSPSGWQWNESLDRPTFTPSILVRSGHYAKAGEAPGNCWCDFKQRTGRESDFECFRCHSFVTDGRIQFLADCSHALAGQTVDLPPWPHGTAA